LHAVQSHKPSKGGHPPEDRRERELIQYISGKTGIDESTVLKVLNAEEEFFVLQVEEALRKKSRGVGI
jgi:hypothetical protein